MTINRELEGDKLTLKIEGKIDTKTSPELEKTIRESLDGIKELIFDLEQTSYFSSAGLRVLLIAQKQMNKQGTMKAVHVNSDLMEILEITGFLDILTVE